MREKFEFLKSILPDTVCPVWYEDAVFEEMALMDKFVHELFSLCQENKEAALKAAVDFWQNIMNNDKDLITPRMEDHVPVIGLLKCYQYFKGIEEDDQLSTDLKLMFIKNFHHKP